MNPSPPLNPRKLQSQARACAVAINEILQLTIIDGKPADRALSSFLRANRQYGGRDRRLVSETLFASLRWWSWLDAFLPSDEQVDSGRPGPWGRFLLGAVLLEPGELPAVASVWADWARVNLPERITPAGDAPLHERWKRLRFLFGDQPLPDFGVIDLIPEWCLDEIATPKPLEELVDWLQRRPPVWLRVQREEKELKEEFSEVEIEMTPHPTMPQAFMIVPPRLNLRSLQSFRRGRFEVQDMASQVIALICDPQPGQRWWDTCAGGGGKSLHLSSLMQSRGSIVASDIRMYKLDDLKKRARRAEFSNIRTREWKGRPYPKFDGKFDGVLVDAPCSCSGTWRRNPDARWTTQQEELDELVELQGRLLKNAASGVRSGGVLVYATCSLFTREDEGVVEAFLEENPEFRLAPFVNPLAPDEKTDGTLRIWPWDGDCDAMFAARFVRE